jgi:hypothetical protein
MIGKFEMGQIVPRITRPRVILDVALRGYCGDRTAGPVSAWGAIPFYNCIAGSVTISASFYFCLLLSGSRPDALKRAQLDHLCAHTLKGP